jgi:hypothetical protein
MENNIPTAETLLESYRFKAGEHIGNSDYDLMCKFAIEFAKLHCEAQSKAILKKVKQEIACDAYSTEHFNLSVKPSIINAYPLDKII